MSSTLVKFNRVQKETYKVFETLLLQCFKDFFLFRLGIEDVKDLHSEYLDSHYLVQLLDAPVSTNDISLSAFVYKEEYPMMYKIVGRKIEVYSTLTDDDTIRLYRENKYEVSEDGTYIKHGKFIIPIE